MKVKRYKINEYFYSLQGEGKRAGSANVFLRFTGCNLQCSVEEGPKSPGGFDCDTEFESGRMLRVEEVIEACEEVRREKTEEVMGKWVIFTGGEPAIQLDRDIVQAFQDEGWKCAIETNGSMEVSGLGLDWITVSPKVAEHAIRQLEADEVKYVRAYGQAVPKPRCQAEYQLISPVFNGLTIDRKALEWCIDLVKAYPEWELSIQNHKAWKVQ